MTDIGQGVHIIFDLVHHCIERYMHSLIRETQDRDTVTLQIFRPLIIELFDVRTEMIFSVHFNSQSFRNTEEIQNERTEWDLSPEPNTKCILSESIPKDHLFRCHSLSQIACFIDGGRGCLEEVPSIVLHTLSR